MLTRLIHGPSSRHQRAFAFGAILVIFVIGLCLLPEGRWRLLNIPLGLAYALAIGWLCRDVLHG